MTADPLPLSDADWKAAYLFTTCVYEAQQIYDTGTSIDPETPAFGVMRHNVLGDWMGWHRHSVNITDRSADFREAVSDYNIERTRLFDLVVDVVMLRLRLPAALHLLKVGRDDASYSDRVAYNDEVIRLIDEICPPWRGKCDRHRLTSHYLYFEPRNILVPYSEGWDDRVDGLYDGCIVYFGTGTKIRKPVMLQDVLVLPAGGYGNLDSSCIAVRHAPISDDDEWHLPFIPVQLCSLSAIVEVKNVLSSRLESLSLFRDTFFDMYRSRRDFRKYTRSFLDERADAEQAVRKSEEVESELDDRFYTRHLELGGDRGVMAFDDTRLPQGSTLGRLCHPLHHDFRREREAADRRLHKARAQVLSRLMTLTSYLRDATAADLSASNLKIARRVAALTWLMLILGVVAVVVGLMPDLTKASFVSDIRSLTGHHD